MSEPTCNSCNQPFSDHPGVQELCRRNAILLAVCQDVLPYVDGEYAHIRRRLEAAIADATPKPPEPETEA